MILLIDGSIKIELLPSKKIILFVLMDALQK